MHDVLINVIMLPCKSCEFAQNIKESGGTKMGLKTFRGGVHPFDGKEFSKDAPIREVLPKGELVYPLSQHIGAPAIPVVAVGDTVLKGQKIAEAVGKISAPVHASVSGKVKAIEARRVATGDMVNSIIIENDGLYSEVKYEAVEDVTTLSKEQIVNRVKEAGVVGMGGAGFPTYVKLSPDNPETIEYIIANGAECEPYLTTDYRRMIENSEKLIAGLKIMLQLFDNAKAIIGIEDNKPEAIERLTELTAEETRIEVVVLKTKYPQGGERQLIYACTGRAIHSKKLPAAAGCIVDNIETILAIYDAVKSGMPVMKRVSCISGDAVVQPSNFLYSIGTSFGELVEAAGGFKSEPEKIIAGGPMMGFAVFTTEVPTTKTSSDLICFLEDEVSKYEPINCMNCGRCVDVCPENLIPNRLAKFGDKGLAEEFEKWHGLECIECGSCSYICPSRRHVAQSIKTMKKQVAANKKKN